jgi:alpha-1,6-mannosyltransferase
MASARDGACSRAPRGGAVTTPSRDTSVRARSSLVTLVAGYLAIAVVAGAPNSPLTVLLPAGVRPPAWAADLAKATRLDGIGRVALTGIAWILVLVVLGAFAVLIAEAWANRVRLSAALVGSAISLAIAVAAPLLLSRDVYTYAAYGRIETMYHRNPYVAPLSSFPHDPFVAVASAQWLHSHSHYGPAFTLASAAITRPLAGSISATIFSFKLLAGVAIALATVLVTLTAARIRPDRAPLAAALVGLNPVIVVHTVGGGHVDALIAALLAAATAVAVTRPPALSARAVSVTFLLTLACLVKVVIVVVLALWLWWLVRTAARRRSHTLAAHVVAIAALAALSLTPFLAGAHTFAPFATLGGVEAWASPSHLVGRAADAVASSVAGSGAGLDAARIVKAGFMVLFVALVWRLARRPASRLDPPIRDWGVVLLLLALSMPYLLPWYAAWFAPFLGLLDDETVLAAGAFATGVLALTLIPADPFHGLTTPAVMDGVHYGAASVLLVVLAALAARVLRGGGEGVGRPRAAQGLGVYVLSAREPR